MPFFNWTFPQDFIAIVHSSWINHDLDEHQMCLTLLTFVFICTHENSVWRRNDWGGKEDKYWLMSAVHFLRSNLTRKIMSHTIAPEVKNHDLFELNHSRSQSHPVVFFSRFVWRLRTRFTSKGWWSDDGVGVFPSAHGAEGRMGYWLRGIIVLVDLDLDLLASPGFLAGMLQQRDLRLRFLIREDLKV